MDVMVDLNLKAALECTKLEEHQTRERKIFVTSTSTQPEPAGAGATQLELHCSALQGWHWHWHCQADGLPLAYFVYVISEFRSLSRHVLSTYLGIGSKR